MGSSILHRSVFFLILVVVSGCAGEDRSQHIDRNYMESEEYSEFEQSFQEEIIYNEENHKTFTGNLQQLTGCEHVQELTVPFTIDQQRLNQLEKSDKYFCMVESLQKPSYTVKVIAKNQFEDLQVFWILLDRPSVYRNQGMFAATVQSDSLLNYSSVGSYEKDLSKEINSEIQVRQIQGKLIISSTTFRKMIYPFEQENTVEESLVVTPDGGIKVQK